eukprot:GHVU01066192.1.p1 GENE.GHVU01066192.1~~GHVU01066192.1.p1  ORF type:complete len:127 (+),score=13.48 GHVU01066192.1:255-635(+)
MMTQRTFVITLICALRYHDSLDAQMIGASLEPMDSLIYMKLRTDELTGEDKLQWEKDRRTHLWTRVKKLGVQVFEKDNIRQVIVAKAGSVIGAPHQDSPVLGVHTKIFNEVTSAKEFSSRLVGDWT